eukprot:CAMPEP_0196573120 /NCGR_PEP_ID=MMETSP1081-20130531/3065_1 /TAXON_ID=36882 /ORGANISM="Pyramimonas amylifera, Strain CCMP720" /LENGTH=465 /DNA_ID=CAMNT_0041890713 /DNA_START=292 /DNA_END=1689 /DNA_ORIENTATION=+
MSPLSSLSGHRGARPSQAGVWVGHHQHFKSRMLTRASKDNGTDVLEKSSEAQQLDGTIRRIVKEEESTTDNGIGKPSTDKPKFDAKRFLQASRIQGVVAATRAVADVFLRRVKGENAKQRAGWSIGFEVIVEAMRAYLPKVLDRSLIQLYEHGDAHTREQITLALEEMTRTIEVASAAIPPVKGVNKVPARVGGMTGMWLLPPTYRPQDNPRLPPDSAGGEKVDKSQGCVLYFHGGAYLTACAGSHTRLTSGLARAAERPVLAVNYRLAPRNKFEDILADAVEAYEHLLACGYLAKNIIIGGDSAGGHLALSLCAHLATLKSESMPGGVVAFSPWIDLHISMTAEKDSWELQKEIDYLGFALGSSPAPIIYGDGENRLFDNLLELPASVLEQFPPVLIQVGSNEVLFTEIQLFKSRLGHGCKLEVYEGMVHVFQMFDSLEPKAELAVSEAGIFIQNRRQMTQEYV